MTPGFRSNWGSTIHYKPVWPHSATMDWPLLFCPQIVCHVSSLSNWRIQLAKRLYFYCFLIWIAIPFLCRWLSVHNNYKYLQTWLLLHWSSAVGNLLWQWCNAKIKPLHSDFACSLNLCLGIIACFMMLLHRPPSSHQRLTLALWDLLAIYRDVVYKSQGEWWQ